MLDLTTFLFIVALLFGFSVAMFGVIRRRP